MASHKVIVIWRGASKPATMPWSTLNTRMKIVPTLGYQHLKCKSHVVDNMRTKKDKKDKTDESKKILWLYFLASTQFRQQCWRCPSWNKGSWKSFFGQSWLSSSSCLKTKVIFTCRERDNRKRQEPRDRGRRQREESSKISSFFPSDKTSSSFPLLCPTLLSNLSQRLYRVLSPHSLA